MERSLFVSDIHISDPADPRCRLFLRFLDQVIAQPPQNLFLVGDIFDLWISDRNYFVERYREVVERISRLRSLGVEIHYFEGNHDLDLGRFWRDQLGVHIHRQAAYFEINGKIVRVEHGDQMDPSDRGYLFLRWFLRTPLLKFLSRHLPDVFVRMIGERASRASRSYTTQIKTATDSETRSKILRHAETAFAERPFDLLVSGHVHVAVEEKLDRYRVINLGTWIKEPLLLDLDAGDTNLRPLLGSNVH